MKYSCRDYLYCKKQYMVVRYKKQEVHTMATKTANVTARIQPNIKEQAEAILDKIGRASCRERV